VAEVISLLAPVQGVEEIHVTDEDEYFPPPRNIRELQSAVEAALTVLAGASLVSAPSADDRRLAASSVLEALVSR